MSSSELADRMVKRHLRAGWWALGVYLLLGFLLETFHATKAGLYLDVGHETRRLLFRLAHAHGTLLAMVNILYALTIRITGLAASPAASIQLLMALLILPVGFFLGGVWAEGGDPGLGVAVVPAGASALLVGVFLTARAVGKGE